MIVNGILLRSVSVVRVVQLIRIQTCLISSILNILEVLITLCPVVDKIVEILARLRTRTKDQRWNAVARWNHRANRISVPGKAGTRRKCLWILIVKLLDKGGIGGVQNKDHDVLLGRNVVETLACCNNLLVLGMGVHRCRN